MHSNSSIQPWLDFDGKSLPSIQPCVSFGNGSLASAKRIDCSQVCDNSTLLFGSINAQNLVTCGLWSLINNPLVVGTAAKDYGWNATTFDAHKWGSGVPSLLAPFTNLGLSPSNVNLSVTTRNVIGNCFSSIHALTRSGSSQADGGVNAACTTNGLFPASIFHHDPAAPLRECIKSICSPTTLNPDLGGIGVCLALIN